MTATAEPVVEIAEAASFLFDPPLGAVSYRVLYGGRYGIKSWSVARALLILGTTRPLRILCAREYQTSIKESVHHTLDTQIDVLGLQSWYSVRKTEIEGINGTNFFFAGLHYNVANIKSAEDIDLAWIEEAESVSQHSWDTLTPTIRKAGSEIWVTFNPDLPDDPTYQKFVVHPPVSAIVRRIGYEDNCWRTPKMDQEIAEMKERDPDRYLHIYGGEPWTRSDALVLAGKVACRDFVPDSGWQGPYFGADWGFSHDPTTLTRSWTYDDRLWVEYETGGVRWDTERTAVEFAAIPGAKQHVIRADNARPETIHAVSRYGFNIQAVDKWPDSVKDGINHLRSYKEIVVHPRCERTLRESRLWSFKTDPRTRDPLPTLAPGHEHFWDGIRYALAPLIQRREVGMIRMGYF